MGTGGSTGRFEGPIRRSLMNPTKSAETRTSESPAVQSLEKERAERKRAEENGELQEGLEDTFPASDPVSLQNPVKPGSPEE
jgi:hypothetical protein